MRSAKGKALATVPEAALTFYWGPLERQVRVQGSVRRGSEEAADHFFSERPRRSQITAWASAQSEPLPDPVTLDMRMRQLGAKHEGRPGIPRPPYWQVYRVRPRSIEFWQAAARRLHDRVRYMRGPEETWQRERLYP